DQKPDEILDGIRVLGFEPSAPWRATGLLRKCDADVYHSQEPSFGTYLARRAMPHRTHVVTCRETRELSDWLTEVRHPSLSRLQVLINLTYEDNLLVQRAVRQADGVYCAAQFLRAKAQRKYGLPKAPRFLPTPVAVPPTIRKASQPTVCYLARWDRRKRPELFLELARKFPEVRFIALGNSRDKEYEKQLRQQYAGFANLTMPGYVDQFGSPEVSRILSESWVLVNTAVREGLPNAFLEAAAHGCAILSAVDPDGFASRFGAVVRKDDFAAGLGELLQDDRWRARGVAGRRYIGETFELERAIDAHLEVYHQIMNQKRASA
ncbi:MAG TPA: glycosyltransferase family 4 protein, partial [Gemmatimonadales bacterium]|nr:glycosyltransferase family 4 protein [Gemmatimonadales bacterium]